jgi:hypothetical protein
VSAAVPDRSWDARATGCAIALALLAFGLYAANLGDYFLGDDFDLIRSFYDKPLRYLVELLWSNESGDVWKSWGIDPALGRGYLRPVKIWFLALDFRLWGTNPLGFRLTSSIFFAANVLLLHAILRRALPGRPLLACAGAGAAALHPVFSEIVPFITAREEIVATAFGLASFLAFLRHRQDGRFAAPFAVLYALALLSKESSIVFLALPLGFDLAHGRLPPRSRAAWRALLRSYAPAVGVLAAYFALRWIAFGNFKGGDGEATNYLSPAAFVAFHARFFRSLVDSTLFAPGGAPHVGLAAGACALLLVGAAALRLRRAGPGRRRDLLFFGPLWYLGSTAILHGTYFATRHHGLQVMGLVAFATLLVDTLLGSRGARWERGAAVALLLAAAALFLPPTLATSREFGAASRAVEAIRAQVEEQTADLPPGSTISLLGVPQGILPPYYFGWGLLSALRLPFTATDLAARSTVVNARNLSLNRIQVRLPTRYDRVLRFEPGDWIGPELRERYYERHWREGFTPPGVRDAW